MTPAQSLRNASNDALRASIALEKPLSRAALEDADNRIARAILDLRAGRQAVRDAIRTQKAKDRAAAKDKAIIAACRKAREADDFSIPAYGVMA